MSFSYITFKNELINKYSDRLPKNEIEKLLTFEQGLIDDKNSSKRLVIKRILFSGSKNISNVEMPFKFDKSFEKGLFMIMADNLKGKSSVFKIIKFALTGDNDIAIDVKSWVNSIHLQFNINEDVYTAYIDLSKVQIKGALYKLQIDDLIDKVVDQDERVFEVDNGNLYKANIQDFFFKQFQFYHLNWTQKSSQKDKNLLLEAKASWTTYYESIYLTSKASNTLAFGNQEELIFQMLLGLKLTYPINRIKTKLEMTQFELSKLNDLSTLEAKRRNTESKTLLKDFEKSQKELQRLKSIEESSIDTATYFEKRSVITQDLNLINSQLSDIDNSIHALRRSITTQSVSNQDITAEGNRYKELIKKAERGKIALQEHIDFGIFFSNLDIKTCPHCNSAVSQEKKEQQKETRECILCSQHIDNSNEIDKEVFEQKIKSLELEIKGYTTQLNALRENFKKNKAMIDASRGNIVERETKSKDLRGIARQKARELRDIELVLQKAQQTTTAKQKILELEKQCAILDYRIKALNSSEAPKENEEIKSYETRIEILSEALDLLKKARASQNEEIINNFKQLLLDELHDLGITGISEVSLSESFKASYLINDNWVTFDKISEGEQLRVKIAFYLSIIQLEIKFNAGKHPRLLIIDSPNKEEGDKVYVQGLKKLLFNLSEKYKEYLQIIIGTASRELDGAVPLNNTITFPAETYVF
jgi:hypothetical protein